MKKSLISSLCQILKFIGIICMFIVVSGIAQQFSNILFYITVFFSLLYIFYRFVLVFYIIKQYIHHVCTGENLVRKSPSSTTENSEINKDLVINRSFLAIIIKKIPGWLKPFIYFLISSICIDFILNHTDLTGKGDLMSIVLSNIILVKLFFILGSISSLGMILYYFLSLYIYIMFSKKRISVPVYLPQFLINWLNLIKKLVKVKIRVYSLNSI